MMNLKSVFLYAGILLLIYTGSVCYVLASYYHLKLGENWRFFTALAIAIPIVLVEYTFSLHGNHYANKYLDLTALDILIITMCFYFVNLWVLNRFVLKHRPHKIWMEIVAFILIIIAFVITNVIK